MHTPYSFPTTLKALTTHVRGMAKPAVLLITITNNNIMTESQLATGVCFAMTKYSFKAVLKNFLVQAKKVVGKLLQLHQQKTFKRQGVKQMTKNRSGQYLSQL